MLDAPETSSASRLLTMTNSTPLQHRQDSLGPSPGGHISRSELPPQLRPHYSPPDSSLDVAAAAVWGPSAVAAVWAASAEKALHDNDGDGDDDDDDSVQAEATASGATTPRSPQQSLLPPALPPLPHLFLNNPQAGVVWDDATAAVWDYGLEGVNWLIGSVLSLFSASPPAPRE
ncbi:hypothetical protein PLESTF_001368200 [Pleodorina starrii]|nr:hypothetical protein PLESTF_001368200 [Pleodorina starrii]